MDIPPEIEILTNDLIWARHYFNQYKKLYTQSQLRIELLNEVAPGFFRLLQEMFWDQMTVSIARLTDSSKHGKNENLSVYLLPTLAEKYHWQFVDEINSHLKDNTFANYWLETGRKAG